MKGDSLSEGVCGQRVVITGGAGDIGLATAMRFVALGATAAVMDISATALGRVPKGIGKIEVDVGDPAAVSVAFDEIDRTLGGLDILIANAGISARKRLLEITDSEWQRTIDTNLSGVFFCAREAGHRMAAQRSGTVLMTASTNGMKGYANYGHYNASKAGVVSLARTMALELAPYVRVNAVCPGYVETAMQLAEYTPEMMVEANKRVPLGRHAMPDEIANLFVFLASGWSRFITGQTVIIDGGELA